jgi:hypothetical protein
MKNLFNRIATGDIPSEWAFGIVAGAGILALICWHMLTKDDNDETSHISAGLISSLLGVAGLVYFLFFFDVSVPFNGKRIANLDLMSQRQNGIIISCSAIIVGAIWAAMRRKRGEEGPFRRK